MVLFTFAKEILNRWLYFMCMEKLLETYLEVLHSAWPRTDAQMIYSLLLSVIMKKPNARNYTSKFFVDAKFRRPFAWEWFTSILRRYPNQISCIYEKNPPIYYFPKLNFSLKKRTSCDFLEYFFLRKSNELSTKPFLDENLVLLLACRRILRKKQTVMLLTRINI